MTANTRASATWPERDETRPEKTPSPTAEHPGTTSGRSHVAHSNRQLGQGMTAGEGSAHLGMTSDETRRTPLPTDVRDALHEALLAQPAVGVVVCDGEGWVTTMNERMEEFAGRRHLPIHVEEWPRRHHLHGHGSVSPLAPAENPLVIALSGRAVTDAPVVHERPGSPTRLLRCSAVPLRGPRGEALGGLALFVDVTQRALEPAIEHERLLVQAVDHEVRTPLTCIIGHLELLADMAANLRGDARWSWEALVRGTARLQAVMDTLTAQPSRPPAHHEPASQESCHQPAPHAALGESTCNPRSDGGHR